MRPMAHDGVRALAAALVLVASAAACRGTGAPPVYEVKPLIPRGSPFHGVHGLRFDKDDNLYAVSVIGQSVFKVDTATGAVSTFVGPRDGMGDDIAIAPNDGQFVWTAIEDGIVHSQAPGGPHRRLAENVKGANAVSFSPDGKRLFFSRVFYGDGLYELDRTGARPPRTILENIGGLNAFQVGTDGLIYGPLQFKGQVVAINPDTGVIKVVADGFTTPSALKLDFKGSAFVLDAGTREIIHLDLKSGRKRVVAKSQDGFDNLALDSKGRLFVSLSEVNGISEVNTETGAVRQVVKPSVLTGPAGLAVMTAGGADTLYVGDLFGGVKTVNGQTGAVGHTPVDIFQPVHVSATDQHLVVVGQVLGVMQLIDRRDFKKLGEWMGLNQPGDALEAPNGDIVVAETGSGHLLRLSGAGGANRATVATELGAPLGLAWAGTDAVYVTDTRDGRLLRVDLTSKAVSTVADGLQTPEGVAVATDGALLVVEVGGKRITRIDPAGGERTVLAANLPIGFSYGPSLYRSIAVSPSAIYINSDVDNTIYKLTRIGGAENSKTRRALAPPASDKILPHFSMEKQR